MATTFYYVNIIGPGGEDNFVRCDPDRLMKSTLRLYVKATVRDGVSKFTAVNGSQAICHLDEVDVTRPLEAFEELKDQCRDVLCAQGEHGQKLFEELFEALDLPRLISSLGKADVEDADTAVRHILYGMMGMVSRCACELAETHKQAEHMTSAVESIGSVLDQAPSMSRDIYLNWSTAADGLNTAVDRLRKIENSVRQILTDVERGQKEWMVRMDRSSPILKEAYAALETGEDAFILVAYGYRGEAEKRDEMILAANKAMAHVEACRKLERACGDAWEMIVQCANELSAPLLDVLHKALADLKSETRKLTDFESQYDKSVPRPYIADRELICEEEYAEALSHLCDEAWGPIACERRLRHLFDAVLSICSQKPELPPEVANAVKMADQYSLDLLKTLEEDEAEDVAVANASAEARPQPPTLSVVKPSAVAPTKPREDAGASGVIAMPQKKSAATVGKKRVEEIYRLMTAVAYVQTIENRRPFSSFTLKSLLRILVAMGKCTDEEAVAAKPTIKAWYDRDSIKVESLKDAMALQDRAKERWIRFKLKRHVAKLAEAFSDEARETMREHSLTSEAIRQTHSETRAEATRKFKEKRATRAANGGTVDDDSEESDD